MRRGEDCREDPWPDWSPPGLLLNLRAYVLFIRRGEEDCPSSCQFSDRCALRNASVLRPREMGERT